MSSYKLHKFNGYISNLYIAEYDDKLLLMDCGTNNDVERIKLFCENKLNRSMSDIKLAVVTHNHPDHSGGAYLLRKIYGIPIVSGKGVDRWYKGISGFIQHKIDCSLAHLVRHANRMPFQAVMFKRFVKPDFTVSNLDTLPLFPDWKVLSVPGHTLHDIVLYHETDKVLYSSDCIINVNGRYNLPIPVCFPQIIKQSFEKLMKLDATTILPAHGDIIETEDPAKEFQKMIDLIGRPKSSLSKSAHAISMFAPEMWKYNIKKMFKRFKGDVD